MPTEKRIIIRHLAKPSEESVDELTSWFLKAFDLASKDQDLEPMLFKEIVSSSMSGEGVTSKELNDRLEIPRTTVIYHLNRFIGSGLVVRKGRKYQLRSNDMKDTIEELQSDMLHEFNKMLEFAERFDQIITGEEFGGRKETRRTRGTNKRQRKIEQKGRR